MKWCSFPEDDCMSKINLQQSMLGNMRTSHICGLLHRFNSLSLVTLNGVKSTLSNEHIINRESITLLRFMNSKYCTFWFQLSLIYCVVSYISTVGTWTYWGCTYEHYKQYKLNSVHQPIKIRVIYLHGIERYIVAGPIRTWHTFNPMLTSPDDSDYFLEQNPSSAYQRSLDFISTNQ
jgi:hypothetical protein